MFLLSCASPVPQSAPRTSPPAPVRTPEPPAVEPPSTPPASVPSTPSMPLADLIVEYSQCRDIEPATQKQLGYATASFARFLQTDSPTTEHLTRENVNGWLQAALRGDPPMQRLARATARSQRNAILSLWREAWSLDLLPEEPKRILTIKKMATIVETISPDEFRALLEAAKTMRGRFLFGPRRDHLLYAMLLVAYDTGLRPCDVRLLKLAEVLEHSKLAVRQKKTGNIVWVQFRPETVEAVRQVASPKRELAFPFTKDVGCYWFRQIFRRAGVRGTLKWIRRLGATQVEIIQPGGAMNYLGHRTPGLAYQHYVDLRQVQENKPLPPALAIVEGGAA